MLATEAEAWVDFYLVAGPSAAVLIGLLFVALSINREAIASVSRASSVVSLATASVAAGAVSLLPPESVPMPVKETRRREARPQAAGRQRR